MNERPILFSGPMVRAILDGRKTQTRRIAKLNAAGRVARGGKNWHCDDPNATLASSYGQPGDRLWVRETFSACGCQACRRAWPKQPLPNEVKQWPHGVTYREGYPGPSGIVFKPSIFMPRWASRITLEIVCVRIERLHAIGKDGRAAHDVLAEGITREQIAHNMKFFHQDDAPAITYAQLWETINGRGSWAANQWVWVVEFKREMPESPR